MRDIYHEIKSLQVEIINEESKIIEFLNTGKFDLVRKSIDRINSDLKYLSILANGAPIDKNDDRKIMDFLRIHYENVKKLSVPA